MPSTVQLLFALVIVITAAKLGAWGARRLNQPAVLGELFAGLLIGPSMLDVFHHPYFESEHTLETVHELGELGVIFLMFVAGLELQLSDFAGLGKPAALVGSLGVAVPMLMGAMGVLLFGYELPEAIFFGIVLAATSVSISAQTLMELGQLRSTEGLTLLGAAVVDDVLAIAVLSTFVAIVGGEPGAATNLGGVVWIIVRMLLFLAVALGLGIWLLPRVAHWAERLPVSESVISFVVVGVLLFAWASEVFGGVAAITGAFIAGIALSRSPLKHKIESGFHTLTYAFFVPLFLVGIGLTANVRALSQEAIGLAVVVCLIAVLSKVIGAGIGAKFGGLTWPQAVRVGIGMVSRGEVGLIVAGVGVANGLVSADEFTVIVAMVLVTTLITPPLLRLAFRRKDMSNAKLDRTHSG